MQELVLVTHWLTSWEVRDDDLAMGEDEGEGEGGNTPGLSRSSRIQSGDSSWSPVINILHFQRKMVIHFLLVATSFSYLFWQV